MKTLTTPNNGRPLHEMHSLVVEVKLKKPGTYLAESINSIENKWYNIRPLHSL